jgi:hypothetical protein
MTFRDDVSMSINGHNVLAIALSKIARGRVDNGRPMAAEDARQLARSTLTDLKLDWTHVLKVEAEMHPIWERLRAMDDPRRLCHGCQGAGRVGIMACSACGATGVATVNP